MKRLWAFFMILALCSAAVAQEQPPPQDPNAPPPAEGAAPPEPAEPDQQPPAAAQPEAVPPAPATVSLGDFAMKLASGLKLQAPAAGFTPESAAWALVLKGVKVRPDLGSPLTEADAVAALSSLGYKIRTTTPSRVMTSDRVELLLETFIPPDRS